MTGFSCWPNEASPSTTNTQCMVTSNSASTIVELYDVLVQNAKIEIDGPGNYRFQAVDIETAGQTDSAITLNNANADLFLWGTGGGGGGSLKSGSADYAFVWQKQGCLRAYAGTTAGQFGNGDYRLETPCTLRPAHVIANDRSEGNNDSAGIVPLALSSLVYVPPGAGAVNIVLKDNGGAWLGPTNTCSLVKYNGTGTLWFEMGFGAKPPQSVAAEADYHDLDGSPVHILLHVREGRPWQLEFYKDEAAPVLHRPKPDELRLRTSSSR